MAFIYPMIYVGILAIAAWITVAVYEHNRSKKVELE